MSPAKRLRRRSALATWHRRLGLTAALFVLMLSITGLALNHTDSLGLDDRFVGADWLLRWYGIDAPGHGESFRLDRSDVTRLGDRLYLDARVIEHDVGALTGAVSTEGLIIVAVDGDLLVLTAAGDRVERLGREDGIPAGIRAVGMDADGRVIVRTAAGTYRADSQLLAWAPSGGGSSDLRWPEPASPDPALLATLRSDYLSNILTLERVLLDLHSGRIFGRYGPWLMDAAAVLLLVLAVTGVWLWSGLRPNGR
ncbi:MAG: PepSY domain-containing protein, partial [Gammaproteobacteria bacterium]